MEIKDNLEEEKFQKNIVGQLRKVERGKGSASCPMLFHIFHYFLTLINYISQALAPH